MEQIVGEVELDADAEREVETVSVTEPDALGVALVV